MKPMRPSPVNRMSNGLRSGAAQAIAQPALRRNKAARL